MLPFYPLIAAGGIVFWAMTAFAVFWVFWASGDEEDWWGGCLAVLFMWAAVMVTLGPLATFPWLTLAHVSWFLGLYVPIGLGYMVGRWIDYVVENRARWRVILNKYALDGGFTLTADGKIPVGERVEFTKWWKAQSSDYQGGVWMRRGVDLNPKAWEHRHRLTTWAMWWWISDPHGIKRLGRGVREAEKIVKESREKGGGKEKLRPAGDDPDAE